MEHQYTNAEKREGGLLLPLPHLYRWIPTPTPLPAVKVRKERPRNGDIALWNGIKWNGETAQQTFKCTNFQLGHQLSPFKFQ
eukprot:1158529-Pelagomonas_calceolata.AAC.11